MKITIENYENHYIKVECEDHGKLLVILADPHRTARSVAEQVQIHIETHHSFVGGIK